MYFHVFVLCVTVACIDSSSNSAISNIADSSSNSAMSNIADSSSNSAMSNIAVLTSFNTSVARYSVIVLIFT